MQRDEDEKKNNRTNDIKELAVELCAAADVLASAAVANKTYGSAFRELAQKTKTALADLEKLLSE